MIRNIVLAVAAFLFFSPLAAPAADAPSMPHAFFANLKDGDTVTNPIKITFGITGMEIAPAGTTKPYTGHFHLLIDTELTEAQKKSVIPTDVQHLHFGMGQTEATLTLPSGTHTLQILMGDGNHIPHIPPVMSDKITVTVQ